MSDEPDFDVQGQIEYWRGLVDIDLTIAEKLTVEKASQYLAYAKELTAWLTAQL